MRRRKKGFILFYINFFLQNEIKSQADRSAADEEENDDHDDLFKTNGSQTLIEKILHDNRVRFLTQIISYLIF